MPATLGLVYPGPFSWLTRPAEYALSQPRMSEVTGLAQLGDDFMKNVFKLSPGQAGVAPNNPLTIYYVVQVESDEPSVETMRENFMAAMNDPMNWMTYAIVGRANIATTSCPGSTNSRTSTASGWLTDYKPIDARDYE